MHVCVCLLEFDHVALVWWSVCWGPQTKFIRGALREKQMIPEKPQSSGDFKPSSFTEPQGENIWCLKIHNLLGTPNQVHSRSPEWKICDSWKTTIFWGQTNFIHEAVTDKYFILILCIKNNMLWNTANTWIHAIAQLIAQSLAARSVRNLKMSLWLRKLCILQNNFQGTCAPRRRSDYNNNKCRCGCGNYAFCDGGFLLAAENGAVQNNV